MRKRLVISVFAILLALSLVGVPGVCYAVSDQAEPQTTAPGEQAPETEQTTAPAEKVPETEETQAPGETTADAREETTPSEPAETEPQQMLKFSAVVSKKTQTFYPSDLNDKTQWETVFKHLDKVTLEIGGEAVPMEKAISEGMINSATLLCYARMDAENGYCTVTPLSKNGLSAFVFQYPELDLWIRYDVYETPDGKQHVIDEFNLSAPGEELNNRRTAYYDPETRERLEKEDWALSFEVQKTSPTGLTLSITQKGVAQQLGNLFIRDYTVWEVENVGDSFPWMDRKIPRNTTIKLNIDWTDIFGELQPGDYTLQLNIYDDTTKSASKDTSPLLPDYTVWQEYYIPFTVEAPEEK